MDTKMTWKQFVQEHNITMNVTRIDERPDGLLDDLPNHFRCVLKCENRRYTVYYSMGSAHYDEPELLDVLECIADDSASYDNAQDVDDFASEFGIEKPSQAIKIYNACKRTAAGLKRLLGDEEVYQQALWEVERL